MSVDTIQTNAGPNIKVPGYDGPANGCTSKSKTERDSKTQSNVETLIKNIQVSKSYKGSVSIKEICIEGAYVMLENSGKRGDVDLSDWHIIRKIDNDQSEVVYKFPQNTIIKSNCTLTIWNRNNSSSKEDSDIVAYLDWKSGENILTRLVNNKNSERASHNQRTTST